MVSVFVYHYYQDDVAKCCSLTRALVPFLSSVFQPLNCETCLASVRSVAVCMTPCRYGNPADCLCKLSADSAAVAVQLAAVQVEMSKLFWG